MRFKLTFSIAALFSIFLLSVSCAQQIKNMPVNKNDSLLIRRQKMIHARSSLVMPFNMNKVTHYFIDTKTGGILKIKAKNPNDLMQINLIRNHLKKEAGLFSDADFKDPKLLHGKNMPGLKTLAASKGKFKAIYKDISSGAQIAFISADQTVIKAVHTWFEAQLKDHGRDAKN